jgi:histidine ammonia-lyase
MITLGNRLDFEDLKKLAHKGTQIQLDESARKRIRDCKSYLDRKIATSSEPIYGINTGFGSLYHTSIEKYDLSQLQENLLKSHACGLGDQAEQTVVRLMLALKIQS